MITSNLNQREHIGAISRTVQLKPARNISFLPAITLAIASLLIITLFACEKEQKVKIIDVGDQAPEFRLSTFDGKAVSLSDYRGKVVMVHFWATWCPPCVDEIPTLDRLYRQLLGRNFDIIAVSVDEGGAAAVSSFMRKNGLVLPAVLDPGRSVAGMYGTFKFPETYLVDGKGVVREKVIGPRDWAIPYNQRVLRQLLESR